MNANGSKRLEPVLPGQATKKKTIEWTDPEFVANYPILTQYLIQAEYEGGRRRTTSTITIYADGDALTVILNDRENNRSAFFNEASLFSALMAIEQALGNDCVDWRIRKTYGPQGNSIPF